MKKNLRTETFCRLTHRPNGRRKDKEDHSIPAEQSHSLLTSAPTVQGFKARGLGKGKSH